MKTVIIKLHDGGIEIISGIPASISASLIVEKWARNTIAYQMRGKPPAHTWKVAESTGIVGAMIEAASMPGKA